MSVPLGITTGVGSELVSDESMSIAFDKEKIRGKPT